MLIEAINSVGMFQAKTYFSVKGIIAVSRIILQWKVSLSPILNLRGVSQSLIALCKLSKLRLAYRSRLKKMNAISTSQAKKG